MGLTFFKYVFMSPAVSVPIPRLKIYFIAFLNSNIYILKNGRFLLYTTHDYHDLGHENIFICVTAYLTKNRLPCKNENFGKNEAQLD